MPDWLRPDSRLRRLAIAVGVYLLVTGVFFAVAAKARLVEHTPYNHFALLAEAWLDGRLDLDGSPPSYARNNDFARFEGKWYVAFPPFPALLLVPVVAFAGSAENVRDGQIFIWLAGIAPSVLFLALEKLRRTGRSGRTELTSIVLALLFAFGSVYFFTSLQGTVWFAAHVVAAGLAALYLLFALDGAHPLLAGTMIGFAFLTRTPLAFAVPLFAVEAARVCLSGDPPAAGGGSLFRRVARLWRRLDHARLFRAYASFSVPIVVCIGFALWHNQARFGDALDFGYEHLTVAWQSRMKKWGLFDYHYLARNLGVVLTGFPWIEQKGEVPFRINAHGLALWLTTPLYLFLVWPRRTGVLQWALYATVALVALPALFYQNTGWVQFGYRFSNDYAVFLFALLAVTGHRFGTLFSAFALWSVVVNSLGAATFDRGKYKKFYYEDRSQRTFYQPD